MMVCALNQTHRKEGDFTANKNYRPQDVHQNLEAAESRRQLGHFENQNSTFFFFIYSYPCNLSRNYLILK